MFTAIDGFTVLSYDFKQVVKTVIVENGRLLGWLKGRFVVGKFH